MKAIIKRPKANNRKPNEHARRMSKRRGNLVIVAKCCEEMRISLRNAVKVGSRLWPVWRCCANETRRRKRNNQKYYRVWLRKRGI